MSMRKKKTIWKVLLLIIAILLVLAIGSGCWFYFSSNHSEPVNVYSFMHLGMTEYWGDQQESYGPVSTKDIQTIFLSETQTVTDLFVSQGDTVQKGDLLMTFDTTLSDISLERKRLEVEKLKLDLQDAYAELSEIKAMKPMVLPEVEPEDTEKDYGDPLSGKYQISTNEDFDGSSQDTALICWLSGDTVVNDTLLDSLLEKVYEYRGIEPTEPTEDTEDPETTAPATEPSDEAEDTEEPTEESSEETEPTKEPSEETEPAEKPSEETEDTEAPSDENEDTEDATDETEPTEPPESIKTQFYVVIKVTEGDTSAGPILTWQGLSVTHDSATNTYSFWFYDASDFADHTLPEHLQPQPEPEIDYGSGYTAAQIAEMRAQQEKLIRDLEFQIKMAEADYKIMQTEVSDGNVYADMDGTVISVLSPEEALLNQQPLLKVSSGGGFYVEGSIGELQKDTLLIGQEVTVNDWNTGMTYTGTVESIADYPRANDGSYYGNGNPNVSLYPFTVYIDGSADLQAGSYVSVMYSAASMESGIYLENPYLRTEQGKSYIYVQGADGLLEKRFVTTGKSLWGSYTEILSGLTAEDLLAFPYGKNVKAGAETREADISELYGY